MYRMGSAGQAFFDTEIPRLGWYIATVLGGLAIHALIVLPAIFWVGRKQNPYKYLLGMGQALMTAFGTASSSATLPITMECAENNNKISERTAGFVLPLGATINMDGTALYEAVAVIFIAQTLVASGQMEALTVAQMIVIFFTATLAAIGAAGIPEAGLVMMAIVLTAVGIDPEHAAMILAVDWFLDRFRTAVNVAGDSIGAGVIDHLEGGGGVKPEIEEATV
ncbi:MAG: dicarboxylate/amino acid:cation symporter, partial [Planctomycetes bacterium]|nr:dicarboxylate/amino acid:cation symporter [Planctomycetota bacterium]